MSATTITPNNTINEEVQYLDKYLKNQELEVQYNSNKWIVCQLDKLLVKDQSENIKLNKDIKKQFNHKIIKIQDCLEDGFVGAMKKAMEQKDNPPIELLDVEQQDQLIKSEMLNNEKIENKKNEVEMHIDKFYQLDKIRQKITQADEEGDIQIDEQEKNKKKQTQNLVKGVLFNEKIAAFSAVTQDIDDSSKRKTTTFHISKQGWRKSKNMAEKFRLKYEKERDRLDNFHVSLGKEARKEFGDVDSYSSDQNENNIDNNALPLNSDKMNDKFKDDTIQRQNSDTKNNSDIESVKNFSENESNNNNIINEKTEADDSIKENNDFNNINEDDRNIVDNKSDICEDITENDLSKEDHDNYILNKDDEKQEDEKENIKEENTDLTEIKNENINNENIDENNLSKEDHDNYILNKDEEKQEDKKENIKEENTDLTEIQNENINNENNLSQDNEKIYNNENTQDIKQETDLGENYINNNIENEDITQQKSLQKEDVKADNTTHVGENIKNENIHQNISETNNNQSNVLNKNDSQIKEENN